MTLVLLIAVPLGAALLILLAGSRLPRAAVGATAVASAAFAFGIAGAMAQAFAAGKSELVAELGAWVPLRGADLTLRVDPAAVPLALAITAVAIVVAAAAAVELPRASLARFAFLLQLILAGTLALVVAGDLALLLLGWGVVGAAGAVAVAVASSGAEPARDGAWSLAIARIGDACLLLATLALLGLFQTVDLAQIAGRLALVDLTPAARGTLVAASLLAVAAAGTRIGLAPIGAWAPRAAARPRAVVAATHSLVMASGTVLALRLAAVLDPGAIVTLGAFGAATALFAGAAALADARASLWRTVALLGAAVAALAASAFGGALVLVVALFTRTAGALAPPTRSWRVVDGAAWTLAVATAGVLTASVPALAAAIAIAAALAAASVTRDVVAPDPAPATRAPGATVLAGLAFGAAAAIAVAALAGAVSLGTLRIDVSPGAIALGAAAVGLGGAAGLARVPLPRRARRRWSDAAGFAGLPRVAGALFGGVAQIVERGGDGVLDALAAGIIRVATLASRTTRGFGGSSDAAHEGLVLAAAIAIVLFWITR